MSLFAAGALGGTGLGPLIAGWIEMDSRLGWRWIQWIQMMQVPQSFCCSCPKATYLEIVVSTSFYSLLL